MKHVVDARNIVKHSTTGISPQHCAFQDESNLRQKHAAFWMSRTSVTGFKEALKIVFRLIEGVNFGHVGGGCTGFSQIVE